MQSAVANNRPSPSPWDQQARLIGPPPDGNPGVNRARNGVPVSPRRLGDRWISARMAALTVDANWKTREFTIRIKKDLVYAGGRMKAGEARLVSWNGLAISLREPAGCAFAAAVLARFAAQAGPVGATARQVMHEAGKAIKKEKPEGGKATLDILRAAKEAENSAGPAAKAALPKPAGPLQARRQPDSQVAGNGARVPAHVPAPAADEAGQLDRARAVQAGLPKGGAGKQIPVQQPSLNRVKEAPARNERGVSQLKSELSQARVKLSVLEQRHVEIQKLRQACEAKVAFGAMSTAGLGFAGVALGWNPIGWVLLGGAAVSAIVGLVYEGDRRSCGRKEKASSDALLQAERAIERLEVQLRIGVEKVDV